LDLIKKFGKDKTLDGQLDIESSWILLKKIIKDTNIKTKVDIFNGLTGYVNYEQIYEELIIRKYKSERNIKVKKILISNDAKFLNKIPKKFNNLFKIVKQKRIQTLLETEDKSYIAVSISKKGCTNSATLCEEIINFLNIKYTHRFHLFEETKVESIELDSEIAKLKIKRLKLKCKKVIMCTNGFVGIKIINKKGGDIHTPLYEHIKGKVAYMKGYVINDKSKPAAISYHKKDPYFYLTRRKFKKNQNLICIGGPEFENKGMIQLTKYPKISETIINELNNFIIENRNKEFLDNHHHEFQWSGLMGYLKDGVRIIGPDKRNKILMYNLGCNGVGILPSIFGAKKISDILNNKILTKSIFDASF